MDQLLRSHADQIIKASITAVLPDEAVKRALEGQNFPGRVLLVSAGKAAWQMARTGAECLGERLSGGVAVTKYGHVMGEIPGVTVLDTELRRGGVSYTADTLDALKRLYPDAEFALLLGADKFLSFTDWYRSDEILQNASLAVFSRGKYPKNEELQTKKEKVEEEHHLDKACVLIEWFLVIGKP